MAACLRLLLLSLRSFGAVEFPKTVTDSFAKLPKVTKGTILSLRIHRNCIYVIKRISILSKLRKSTGEKQEKKEVARIYS